MNEKNNNPEMLNECPYCGEDIEGYLKRQALNNDNPWDDECPHCNNKIYVEMDGWGNCWVGCLIDIRGIMNTKEGI